MKTALAVSLAVLLAACGGGDDGPETEAEKEEYILNSKGPWTCSSFAWKEQAQAWYDRHPGQRPDLPPEYTLDKDNDGKVDCNLPLKSEFK